MWEPRVEPAESLTRSLVRSIARSLPPSLLCGFVDRHDADGMLARTHLSSLYKYEDYSTHYISFENHLQVVFPGLLFTVFSFLSILSPI